MRKPFYSLVILLIIGALTIDSDIAFAQRYSHENSIGGVENVKFYAERNGNVIEFKWNVRTTRDIVSIEVQKGIPDQRDEIEWKLLRKMEASANTCIDYEPRSGRMFYKLILIGKDGTAREYKPEFGIKDKS